MEMEHTLTVDKYETIVQWIHSVDQSSIIVPAEELPGRFPKLVNMLHDPSSGIWYSDFWLWQQWTIILRSRSTEYPGPFNEVADKLW